MASEGKLTADVLINALSNAAADVDAKFAKMPETIESAWTRASDVIGQGVGKAIEAEGATKGWIAALNDVTKWAQSEDGIGVFQTLAGAIGWVGDAFASGARQARVMAEETRLAAETAKANEGILSKVASALWSIGGDAAGAIGAIARRALTGANDQQRALAESVVDWKDGTTVTKADAISASAPGAKLPVKFGAGGDDEQAAKKAERLRAELTKNVEVERLRAAVTRAELDGNMALSGELRTQLEIRNRISDDARKASPEKAAALEQEIRLQNQLEIQLENVRAVQERNNEFARDFASTISQGFASAIQSGKTFGETLKDIGLKLADVVLQATLFKPFEQSLSNAIGGTLNGSGGFDIGSLFSSGATTTGWGATVTPFASGGVINGRTPFTAGGMSGVAGEAGPEAIIPLKRGSNGQLGVVSHGSGGSSYSITINVDGDMTDTTLAKVERVFESRMAAIAPGIVRESVAEVRRNVVGDRNFLRRG